MLAVLGGNESPTAADVKKILAAVDAPVEDDVLERVMAALTGKNVFDVIAEGSSKLSSVPSGGVAGAGAAGGAAGGDAAAKEEEKQESEEESEEEEELGFDLFD